MTTSEIGNGGPGSVQGSTTTTFGCDDCSRRGSEHCTDCVVSYLCADDNGAVVVSLDEMRLVRRLQDVGLAPPLRHSSA
ncbi:MAG: hypothetical protein ACK5O2_03320 [Microthrixaceae bacterium]